MTTATRELASIKNSFAGLKQERFTSEMVEAKVQEYIHDNDPFKIAHLQEVKQKVNGKFAKSKWAIVYDWNANLKDNTFKTKEDAQIALDYYLDHMGNSPAVKCRNALLMDRIRAEIINKMKREYSNKVGELQSKQGEVLSRLAKQIVKSMLKNIRK